MNKFKIEKKAWLRIIEAFLAVMIIFSVVVTVIGNKEAKSNLDKIIYEKQDYILDLIQKNETLRNKVMDTPLNNFDSDINSFIGTLIPRSWDFKTKICGINQICTPDVPTTGKDVYYSERIIVSSLKNNGYSPRKLVLAVWVR